METVLRAALTYLFLFIVLRAIGKKELSGMSAFELVMLVIMGDLVQQGVTQQDNSLTAAFLAVGTIALLIVLASYISFRFQRTSTVTDGLPVVVIRDGKVLRQVIVGVLETDGTFSFVTDERRRQQAGSQPPVV